MRKIKAKANVVCVVLVMVMSYLVIYYAFDRIEVTVPTTAVPQNDYVIILDAGQPAIS